MDSFLKKDLAGLPVWGWALIVVGGVGAGLLFLKFSGKSGPNASAAGTTSAGQAGTSEAAGVLAGQSGNGTVPQTFNNPDTGFASTTVNGQQVPILPPGYVPITDGAGNVIGYAPSGGSTTSGNGTTTTTTPPPGGAQQGGNPPRNSKIAVTTKSASLETTPRDAHGGHNLLTVPSGGTVTYVSGPVPDPQGTSKQYYKVIYNGQTGYIGSDALPGNPFSAGNGGGSDGRYYRTNVLGAY